MYSAFGLLINGQWVSASDGGVIEVHSPVNEARVGTIPAATSEDIAAALSSAENTAKSWAAVPAWSRAALLRKTAELLRERVDDYANIMSGETGKPIAEARAEINASADQFEWCGEEAKRIYGQSIPGRNPDERLMVNYEAVGPCLALSAWNFPMLLPARKIAAALAAGCPVIARPASEAPGSCMAIGQALMDAGLPSGVLSILTGKSTPMVGELIASPVIRKVSLTGSVAVGKLIMGQAAAGLKKVTMELGGHAPVIVYPDFDPVAAAEKLALTKFRNCGQVCISPSRFYVHEDIYPAFVEQFARIAEGLTLGDGLDPETQIGPLIRRQAVDNALGLVEDAVQKGAVLRAGGQRPEQPNNGHFLLPTVLENVPDHAKIMNDEPFAPVAPIARFSEFNDVIARANATEYGLAAYVFTHDSALATQTANALESGMIGINETLLATAEAPFGGIKSSGFGREGGSLGIMDYLVPKYIRHKLIQGAVNVQ